MNNLKPYAPIVLRIGISLVFLWFGYSQITDQVQWTAYVPDFVMNMSGLQVETIVFLNGLFEVIFGAALLVGFWTRTAALLLALHMFEITYIVGFDATGVRDFGISIAALVIFFNGRDAWSLDTFIDGNDLKKS